MRVCVGGERGGAIGATHPLTTSRPSESIPETTTTIWGHPNGLVLLKVTSIGKFHTQTWRPSVERRVACDIPSCVPDTGCQSFPYRNLYLHQSES